MSALLNRLIRAYAIAYIKKYRKSHDPDEAYYDKINSLKAWSFILGLCHVIIATLFCHYIIAIVGAIVALCFFCFFIKADEVIYDIYWR